MKKLISALVVALLLCSAMIAPSYAAVSEPDIMPLWDSIYSAQLEIAFGGDGGLSGTAAGAARRQTTATSIEGTVTVYKNVDGEWVFVNSAYNSTTRMSLGVSCDFEAEKGVEYMAIFDVTAYTGSVGEDFTMDAFRTCGA